MHDEKTGGFGRRDFLKGAVSAAIAAGCIGLREPAAHAASPACSLTSGLPGTLLPPPAINAVPGTEKFWKQVKKAFPLPDDYIHMNTGTTGSQALFSQHNLAVYNTYKSADPRDWQANLNADFPDLFATENSILGVSGIGPRQAAVAAAYGANPDEIVLSYNTTDACNLIFAGTPWQPGDRIITTSMEHNAIIGPIAWARDYHGVEVAVIDIPSNFDASITVPEVVSWFETELARPLPLGAKQYVVFSEIFYKNGVRMPVKQICGAARNHGAFSIVDSAHAWGMIPVDCHDYGADFIAGAGHKWLCGGPGTGIFYIRTSGSNLPPFAMGNFFLYGDQFTAPSLSYNTREWRFTPALATPPSIAVQLRGESNTPALFAMTDSFSFFDAVGLRNIHDRGVALGTYLKRKIENKWGPGALWVQRNADPAFASFLTSFNPFRGKNDSAQFSAMSSAMSTILANLAAQTPKIYLRSTTWHNSKDDTADNRIGFRISTHAMYNNYSQIDWMFDQLVAEIDASGLPQL
ncbi:aminotransferase class V-fold PLP-dependent enzyme [Geobacter sp. FeAm09]|uniref:aminotransferase class V-fold PLP-dependent enzyme n=1 Tax=Geobacter sp. FeAm09 TaxID=2597769 RepID=UPI0011EE4942|nr:aminotransferase class V-fold PLP-dependent enzyme [Geobacter sp. FeAm09]QEM69231.1 aminotransferase class V-fold PLP-dependent enzyme [Geobacter sp. FeAm09]